MKRDKPLSARTRAFAGTSLHSAFFKNRLPLWSAHQNCFDRVASGVQAVFGTNLLPNPDCPF